MSYRPGVVTEVDAPLLEHHLDLGDKPVILAGVGERLLQHPDCELEVVSTDERQQKAGAGAGPAVRTLEQQLLKEPACRDEVTGGEMPLGRRDRACPSCLVLVDRRQPDRVLKQLGGGLWGAAACRQVGCMVDLAGHAAVWRVSAEREVECPLLLVGHDGGQAQMQLAPVPRLHTRIVHRRKQWMREPHRLAGDLEHTSAGCVVQIARAELADRGAQHRQRRVGERRDRE